MMALGLGAIAMAQNGFNVPYSQYGIGDLYQPFNMPMASGMGGVVYSRAGNNFVNPFNPASYAAVQKESFVFDMGLNIEMNNLKDKNSSLYDADGNVSHILVAFPFCKWWKTSIGLMPYSNVNYQSIHTTTDSNSYGSMKTVYEGVGGLSQLTWGHAFNVGKYVSLGFNINYLTGSIQKAITYDFDQGDTNYFVNSRRLKDTYIRNFTFDFGIQYFQPLGEKYTLELGAVFTPKLTTSVTDKALIYTTNGKDELLDTIFPYKGEDGEYKSNLTQPMKIGVGVSILRNERWRLAGDFTYATHSGLFYEENPNINLFGSSVLKNVENDNMRMALGFQWLGNRNATQYIKRVGFSAGAHYETGKLILNIDNTTHNLNEFGMGVGVTMPMRKGRSLMNISFAYRHFGKLNPLMRECWTIGISISSCETWFQKRKYN